MPVDHRFRDALHSPVAVTRFEMETFLDTHPGFIRCRSNSDKLSGWVLEKYGSRDERGNIDLEKTLEEHPDIYSCAHYEEAYNALENLPRGDPGRLLHADREGFAKLSANEVADKARLNGSPRYGRGGKIEGYDWNPQFAHMPPVDVGPQIPKSQMHWPQDYGKKYTKYDIAMWPADRLKEYLESRGEWGKFELPEDLR